MILDRMARSAGVSPARKPAATMKKTVITEVSNEFSGEKSIIS